VRSVAVIFFWLWLRENRPFYYAVIGTAVLVLYGVIPTLQPANFGRVYAAYGGVFTGCTMLDKQPRLRARPQVVGPLLKTAVKVRINAGAVEKRIDPSGG